MVDKKEICMIPLQMLTWYYTMNDSTNALAVFLGGCKFVCALLYKIANHKHYDKNETIKMCYLYTWKFNVIHSYLLITLSCWHIKWFAFILCHEVTLTSFLTLQCIQKYWINVLKHVSKISSIQFMAVNRFLFHVSTKSFML